MAKIYSEDKHSIEQVKDHYEIFSRESDSTTINVRSFVRLSVSQSPRPLNSLKSFISPYHNIQHHSHHYTYHNTTSQHNITTQHHTQHHQAKSHTVTTIHHPHPQHTITHTNTCTITHNIKTPFISPASMLQSTAPPPSSFDFATFKLFSLFYI